MRRWQVAAAVLMLVSLHATGGQPHDTAPSPLARLLDAAVASFDGTAGVVVTDLRHGDRYAHEAEHIFPSASLYKLGVMIEAYRRVASGSLSLGTTLTVLDEDDEDSYTAAGETLTLREAIERMITVSDNTTAHMLVRLLGARRINATVASLGLTDTRINTALPGDERTAPFNTTSARDMEHLLRQLVKGTVVAPAFSGAMLATLGRQRVNDRLPTGVPRGTFVAHKTGNLDGIAHDAGVITTPAGPRVVVVLTRDYARYDEVTALTRRVAELAYDGGLASITAQQQPDAQPPATPADRPIPVTGAEAIETGAEFDSSEDAVEPAASMLASGSTTASVPWDRPPPPPLPEDQPPWVLRPPVRAWIDTMRSPEAQAGARTPWFAVGPLQPLVRAPTLGSVPWAVPLEERGLGSTSPIVRGPSRSSTIPKVEPTLPAVPAPELIPVVVAAPEPPASSKETPRSVATGLAGDAAPSAATASSADSAPPVATARSIAPAPSPSFTMPKAEWTLLAAALEPAPVVGAAPEATARSAATPPSEATARSILLGRWVESLLPQGPVARHAAAAPAAAAPLARIAPPLARGSVLLREILPPPSIHRPSLARQAAHPLSTHLQGHRQASHGKATRLSSVKR